MYSCSFGICFLKPASTRSWAAKNSITSVPTRKKASVTARRPNTSRSA